MSQTLGLLLCRAYHTNIEYKQKPLNQSLNQLLILNEKDVLLQNNDLMMSTILCDSKSRKCVFGLHSKCFALSNIDKLEIPSLKYSKSCFEKHVDCSMEGHTVKIQQFERLNGQRKGKQKDPTCR